MYPYYIACTKRCVLGMGGKLYIQVEIRNICRRDSEIPNNAALRSSLFSRLPPLVVAPAKLDILSSGFLFTPPFALRCSAGCPHWWLLRRSLIVTRSLRLPPFSPPILVLSMAVELSDVGLLELLSYKLACAETSILEVPFALEYSPELIPYWIEYAPYYYCYTDKTQFSTGNRYVAKDYDGRWKKIETDIIIRDEFNKLLGLKELNMHYRNQRKTGWIMWVYSYSHMPSTQNQSNSPSPSPSIGLVLLKIHFQPDIRDPDLEELTVAAEDMVAPDFNREHPRNPAKRRKFT